MTITKTNEGKYNILVDQEFMDLIHMCAAAQITLCEMVYKDNKSKAYVNAKKLLKETIENYSHKEQALKDYPHLFK